MAGFKVEVGGFWSEPHRKGEHWDLNNEAGVTVSELGLTEVESRYCDTLLPTVLVGGVETPPEHRRHGYVRQMFEKLHADAPERGWAVSLLHPFSYTFYRKFGYEKISHHKTMRFPITALGFAPRDSEGVLYKGEEQLPDLLSVYNRFGEHRQVMIPRFSYGRFLMRPEEMLYLFYSENGEAVGFVNLRVEKHVVVNRYVSDDLHVKEMGYTCPEGLMKILGFIRMFEGENDTVYIHDYGMMPELDFVLRGYEDTTYGAIPDLMARVLDVKAFLSANRYPAYEGHFTLNVEDDLARNRGTWQVEFGKGGADVKKLSEGTGADVTLSAAAMAPLFYGYEAATPELVTYIPGCRVENPESDFFAAFPKRPIGLFEHF